VQTWWVMSAWPERRGEGQDGEYRGHIVGRNWDKSLKQKWLETGLLCKHCIRKPQVWELQDYGQKPQWNCTFIKFGFSIVRYCPGAAYSYCSLVPALPTSIMYFWPSVLLKDKICLSLCCRLSHSRLFFTVSWKRFLYPPHAPLSIRSNLFAPV